jgi:hypothetical protein
VLRNVNSGALQVYNIALNSATGSRSENWTQNRRPANSGDSTSQLVQAMAGFGGAGGAADGMNSAFGTEALQQQQFLTTPQRA